MNNGSPTTIDGYSRHPTPLGVSVLPATNPLEIAKAMTLLLAPVEIPISIPYPVTRALLGSVFVRVMNPLPRGRGGVLRWRGVVSRKEIRIVVRVAVKVKNAMPIAQ
jgi:hypothetical protein